MTMHHDNGTHEDYNTPGWVWLCTAILASLIFSVAINSTDDAHAAQPYGGCAEASQAPKSDGAKQCRRAGWVITKRVAINPRSVVKMEHLPICRYEDGSTQRACTWNLRDRHEVKQGNGRGRALIHLPGKTVELNVCFGRDHDGGKIQCRPRYGYDYAKHGR